MLKFLSTPSARRATHHSAGQSNRHGNFYPRPPRGGRPWLFLARGGSRRISIHALREEGDKNPRVEIEIEEMISIHALREEGDLAPLQSLDRISKFLSTPSARRATPQQAHTGAGMSDFYPRPPRGGRLAGISTPRSSCINFYPRPPRGGRPGRPFPGLPSTCISIHALREEGDWLCQLHSEITS